MFSVHFFQRSGAVSFRVVGMFKTFTEARSAALLLMPMWAARGVDYAEIVDTSPLYEGTSAAIIAVLVPGEEVC